MAALSPSEVLALIEEAEHGRGEELARWVWPKVVAVTGTIGAGKSAFMALLREDGWKTLSADQVVRELREPGAAAFPLLVERFGTSILNEEGRIDSKALAVAAFSSPEARRELESIVLPLLEREVLVRFARLSLESSLLAYEAPTLFEAGAHGRGWRKIVLVTAPLEIKRQRAMARDGATEAEVEARLAAQWPDERKAPLADFVADNSGDLEGLRREAKRLLRELEEDKLNLGPER